MSGPEQSRVQAPSFRFGLKSLGALTFVAGLIFAAISFAGLFYGLLISFGIAFLCCEIVFIAGVAIHGRLNGEHRRTLSSWLLACSMLAVVLFLGVCFAGGGKLAADYLSEVTLKKKCSDDLGFTFESEGNFVGDQFQQTVRITSISPGSEFERAGFLVDDVIVDWETSEFFDELSRNRGEEMTVNVVTASSSFQATQLDKLPQRAVTFSIPE